jgi:CubicO group peptidase (beta-lactamase class C family)
VRDLPQDDPIRAFLSGRVVEGWMPGAAWWVEGAAGVVSRGAVGLATREPRAEPLREPTPFDLASLTKPLATGLLLALLEQDGELNLASPVGDWLPPLRDSPYGPCSLLDLATHRAGLVAWKPLYLYETTLDGYIERIATEPPALPAGQVLYSDLGYILLGAVLERAGGLGLAELFARRVASPLGLERTGFAVAGGFADAAATERGNAYEQAMAGRPGEGHAWRMQLLRGEVHDANAHGLGGAGGHAGLFGPVEEVASVARELLRPSAVRLGDRARRRLLFEPASGVGRTVGLVCASHSCAARGLLPADSPGHTGFTGTSVWLDPLSAGFYVLLTNRVHPQVPARSFQWLRRGFHRLATSLTPLRKG